MNSDVKRPVRRKVRGCALCRELPRYNSRTAAAIKEADSILAQIVAGKRKPMTLEEVRADLDPMFYKDLESFRKAVEDGTVDRDKGCRNMRECRWSVRRKVA